MTDTQRHLLLIEDEAPLREAVAEHLIDRGYLVEQAESGETALAKLADFAFDIIVTDLRLPGIGGSAVVEAAVARYPDIIAIVVTGYGTVKDAVEAIKRGAWDFVSKPFQIDELLHVLESALEQRRLRSENAYLRAQLEERYRFEGVVGKGRQCTCFSCSKAATTARFSSPGSRHQQGGRPAIHHNVRDAYQFVALNCSRSQRPLEASSSGTCAFTGAIGNRQGARSPTHKARCFSTKSGR